MSEITSLYLEYAVLYASFAAVVAAFFLDFARVSRKTFCLWTGLCVLYVAAFRTLCGTLSGPAYSLGVLLALVNCLLTAVLALRALVGIPGSMVLYALAFVLEYACFITGNAVWNVENYEGGAHDIWLYFSKLFVCSGALCLVVRRWIVPLYKSRRDGKMWLQLSISPALGAVGYYIMINLQGDSTRQLPITSYVGNCVLFAALMAANALCAVSVGRSLQTVEAAERLSAANRLLALQKEQYAGIAERVEQTREMRHNFRHQAGTMAELLREGRLNELREYLARYAGEIPPAAIFTGNAVADAVFGHYLAIAEQEKIRVDYQVALPSGSLIGDTDFSVLIGNCMENAVEASLRLPEEQREIRVRTRINGDFLMMVFENRFDGTVIEREGRIFSRKRGGGEEGVGLTSVRRIAGQHGGEMAAEHSGNRFYVKLSLKWR